MLQDIVIVLVLVLANGLFSMVEMAMVSARRATLQNLAEAGVPGASTALRLLRNPGAFLSTVQFGITVVGVFTGAFSGARFAEPLARMLPDFPLVEELAFTMVVVLVAFVSIVWGELIPKQIALKHAVPIAIHGAPVMALLAMLAYPIVSLLDGSARLGLTLLRQSRSTPSHMSADEVRLLIAESTRAGVFSQDEMELLDRVMDLGERRAGSLMTPRHEVIWLDGSRPLGEQAELVFQCPHPRMPLCLGKIESVLGVVLVQDLTAALAAGWPVELRSLARPATVVPESLSAVQVLRNLNHSSVHLLVVVDEFGSFAGVVSASDVLNAVAGTLGVGGNSVLSLPTSSADLVDLLIDASLPIADVERILGEDLETDSSYHTLAGLALECLGHIPKAGERFRWRAWDFEIAEMEDRRVARLRVRGSRVTSSPPAEA